MQSEDGEGREGASGSAKCARRAKRGNRWAGFDFDFNKSLSRAATMQSI